MRNDLAPPRAKAANTVVLYEAFDRLVGPERWHPRQGLGTFPVRFPSAKDPATTARTWRPASPVMPGSSA
jgi:hypothetical protein